MSRFFYSIVAMSLLTSVSMAQDAKELAGRARTILKEHCFACHSGTNSTSGYEFDVTRPDSLLGKHTGVPATVVAGKPAESSLWEQISTGRMPPKGKPRMTPEDQEIVKKWIEANAPSVVADTRAFVSTEEVLESVRAHLRKAPREKREFLKYFTLTHLHNNPAVANQELPMYRAALSKALNSLSWKPDIVVPTAVDQAGTVFAVDIRELDWDIKSRWKAVIAVYPYGLRYTNHPNKSLKDKDAEIAEMLESGDTRPLPIIRADWFVATATRPPLYHILVDIPKNAEVLEKRLGVDVPENFRKDKLARAGFAKSGVSSQNRLVERHSANYGAYWKSYDFLPAKRRANLVRFPLGPDSLFRDGERGYRDQAFVHDGGEIIFNLPNGLQGYMLVDGKDNRIDEGPIAVVSDGQKITGTPAIVNGVSCMSCHKNGILPVQDSIRDGSALFGDPLDKLRRVYPEATEMGRLIKQDEGRFLLALEQATGPFLRVDNNKDKPLQKFAEPVAEVMKSYRLGYLDLQAVACEVGEPKAVEMLNTIGKEKFKRLGLEALTRPGGLIGRAEWEALEGMSLMQELSAVLGAVPVLP